MNTRKKSTKLKIWKGRKWVSPQIVCTKNIDSTVNKYDKASTQNRIYINEKESNLWPQ